MRDCWKFHKHPARMNCGKDPACLYKYYAPAEMVLINIRMMWCLDLLRLHSKYKTVCLHNATPYCVFVCNVNTAQMRSACVQYRIVPKSIINKYFQFRGINGEMHSAKFQSHAFRRYVLFDFDLVQFFGLWCVICGKFPDCVRLRAGYCRYSLHNNKVGGECL